MAEVISDGDLSEEIKDRIDPGELAIMLAGVNARVRRIAPCLAVEDPDPDQLAEAKLVLLGAIKRWADTGAGAFQQQTAGPFSVSTDTRQRGGYNLWPSEIDQLQDICGGTGGVVSVGLVGPQYASEE